MRSTRSRRRPDPAAQVRGVRCWPPARGDEAETLELFEWGRRELTERGEGSAFGAPGWLTALLHNGHGHYDEALAAARQACEHEDVMSTAGPLVELIEAGVRSGQPGRGRGRARTAERAHAGERHRLGARGRSALPRALLSDAERAALPRVARAARAQPRGGRARARRLLYGEWLRRENRRVDAREQLRAAYEMFSHMGAEAFAERARRELLATGETVRKRTAETRDDLTAARGTGRPARS